MSDVISFVQRSALGPSAGENSAARLTENFDTFLTLLTSQMKNQDPLNPTDATEFTNQLVQFSGVEQQIQSNQNLEKLISASNASTGTALSSYLGQMVEIDSSGAGYYGEDITWTYSLESDAKVSTISVTDEEGNIIFSTEGEKAGEETHSFTWDGKLKNGTSVDQDEVYYMLVTAENAEGTVIDSTVRLNARVTGVDLSYDSPALETNVGIFGYEDLLRISQQKTTDQSSESAA